MAPRLSLTVIPSTRCTNTYLSVYCLQNPNRAAYRISVAVPQRKEIALNFFFFIFTLTPYSLLPFPFSLVNPIVRWTACSLSGSFSLSLSNAHAPLPDRTSKVSECEGSAQLFGGALFLYCAFLLSFLFSFFFLFLLHTSLSNSTSPLPFLSLNSYSSNVKTRSHSLRPLPFSTTINPPPTYHTNKQNDVQILRHDLPPPRNPRDRLHRPSDHPFHHHPYHRRFHHRHPQRNRLGHPHDHDRTHDPSSQQHDRCP